jgi:hypothetical protein
MGFFELGARCEYDLGRNYAVPQLASVLALATLRAVKIPHYIRMLETFRKL